MRVLVTGGTGFVGHAVARCLARDGHEVSVLTRVSPGAHFGGTVIRADLRDRQALREALTGREFDGVCHLAGLAQVRASFADPLTYFDVNVAGTINLLHTLAETIAKPPAVVFASTAAVYGSGTTGRLREDSPAHPDTPYAETKYAVERLLHRHADTGAIGAASLRCFAISGACQGVGDRDETRILPKALRVAAGLAPAVLVNGDGSAVREFTHVLDVAEAYRVALATARVGECSIYNVGSGEGISMLELVRAVRRRTGRPVAVEHRPAQPEPHTLVADSSRIRQELGWSPTNSHLDQIIDDAWHALHQPADASTATP